MLGNFLIGLREGLEATLVVVLLMAYLTKTGRNALKPKVWAGVVAAVMLSAAFGALLTFGPRGLTFEAQEAIGGSLSILAVALVTWMLTWMAKASKSMDQKIADHVDSAEARGTTIALVAVGALSVGREGLETTLFLWAAARGTGETWEPLVAALAGIALAIVVGLLVNRGAMRLDLRKFFAWTAGFLVFVAAGILAYAVHDLQEAGILPGLHHLAFDVSHVIAPAGVLGTLLKAIFNIAPAMTVLEVTVWVLYVAIVFPLFLRRLRGKKAAAQARTIAAEAEGERAGVSPAVGAEPATVGA